MNTQEKYSNLYNYIKDLGSLCVAFSGGVDSTFLLDVAYEVLGTKVLAVTVRSSMYTQREFEESCNFAEKLGLNHIILDADEYNIKEFVENSKDRCYHCKYAIFTKIKKAAEERGVLYVADGSNADDANDYRPGTRAIQELNVLSPLKANGLTKQEIRDLSQQRNLPTWNKPSMACLASRIPYGTPIKKELLQMVEQGEDFLFDAGFKQFRVRHHGNLARIEILAEEMDKCVSGDFAVRLVNRFKEIGFDYVTMDLEGYRMGSLNEVLKVT